jgi:hypothetical protein
MTAGLLSHFYQRSTLQFPALKGDLGHSVVANLRHPSVRRSSMAWLLMIGLVLLARSLFMRSGLPAADAAIAGASGAPASEGNFMLMNWILGVGSAVVVTRWCGPGLYNVWQWTFG